MCRELNAQGSEVSEKEGAFTVFFIVEKGYPIVEVGYSEAELPYMIIALNIHICVMIGG
jgi:hypothetical protein